MCRLLLTLAVLVGAASRTSANVESVDAVPRRVTVMPARPFVGAGQHKVPLVAPAWHGIEPRLAIAYSTSGGNGWLGVGMTLEGTSTIERVSASRGAPTYTASDTYELDDEPLLACVAGSTSPSCMAGGTHTTRRDNHARIVKSGTSWTVTSPAGVVERYTTFAEPIAVLTSRTDASGNAVTYAYATTGGTSYLTSIAYNGTTITFSRATRPDPMNAGIGNALRQIDQRLITVAVRTDGALERAYRLDYSNVSFPAELDFPLGIPRCFGGGYCNLDWYGRSYLTSVREYGSDATFNAAGKVTGGSSLPPTTFAYNPDPAPLGPPTYSTTIVPPSGYLLLYDRGYVADVNGDGRDDAIAMSAMSTGGTSITGQLDLLVRLGQADGSFASSAVRSTFTTTPEIGWYNHVRTGDVNGDGRADLIFVRNQTTFPCCSQPPIGFVDVAFALGTASGAFTFPAAKRISTEGYSGQYHFLEAADFDGDGRTDLSLVRFAPPDPPRIGSGFYGEVTALVSLSTGSGYATAVKRTLTNLDDGTSWGSLGVHAGDVDGDGRDDLVVVQQGSNCSSTTNLDRARAHTFISKPGATFGADVRTSLTTICGESFAGETLVDVNNDGRADLVGDRAFTILGAPCTDNDCDSDVTIGTNLGRGDGSFAPLVTSTVWSGGGVGIGYFTGAFVDVNGDHLPDRVAIRAQTGTYWTLVNYNLGNGQFATATTTKTTVGTGENEYGCSMLFGDVDGDGRLSVVKSCVQYYDWHLVTIAPTTRDSGLLATATLPSGGSVGFDYTTSSSFANGYLPFSFPVLGATRVRDGRGQVATTSYSYTGGLYVPAERRFFGFATSRSTDPSGAIRDVAYTQHVADPDGTVASTHERTGTGALVRYNTITFARTGNGTTAPFTSTPTRRYEYECNGLATCKATSRGWTYSPYGAVASEIEYGDDAITGDERTTFHTQAVNAAAFITQLDATVDVRAGAGVATGTQLAYTETAYDEASAVTTPPTRGLATAISRWRGGTAFAIERAHHDAAGNVIAKIDPVGATTTLAYDARHRLASTTNPLGHAEARTYDTLGRLATITDANGGVTQHAYDTFGRLVQRTTPDGAVVSATFASWGNPATQYVTTAIADGSADGLWKRTYLDGLLRPWRVVAEGGVTTDTTYDGRGLSTARSAPYLTGATPAWTTTTYDAVARPLRVTEPDGAAVITTYGNWSVSTTNQRGLVTDRFYDAYRQLVQVVERTPTPQTTTITYDLIGNRVGITDAAGNTTTAVFDRLHRRTDAYDPDLGHWQYGYDDAGRVIRRIDARGIQIDSTYDALGRPRERRTGATVLAAFFYDEVAAGYANVGRMTHFTDPTGTTRRDYDAAGRVRSEHKTIGGDTYRVDWSFDAAGRLASIEYPAVAGVREHVALGYDAAGRPNSVGEYVAGATYDAWGNVTSATFGNAAAVARTYSPTRGWMLGQTVTVGGAVRDQFAVTRALSGDVLGRTSTVEARDAWLFAYDALGRLTSANNTTDDLLDESFTYDAIGNRLSARRGATTDVYAYPSAGAAHPHAPVTVGGTTVRYDANGNRRGIGPAPDATYDAMNRLVDDGTTTYAYDAEGTRVRAGTKVFVRDLFEVDGIASWRYYSLGNERIARRDAQGTVLYYHGDAIGSVRKLTSSAGAVVGTKLVFAFGELAAASGLDDPFALAGQRLDPSGLYHLGARRMDPMRGQFTQPDPSDDPDPARPQTLNRYSYAYNNPTRLVDPTGFAPRRRRRVITLVQGDGGDTGDAGDTASTRTGSTGGATTAKKTPNIRILKRTGDTLQWTDDNQPGSRFEAPRLYSKAFDAEREAHPSNPAYAFDSQTGRLFGDHAFASVPSWTMGEALENIDVARERGKSFLSTDPPRPYDPRQPQYLESRDGALYRYNEDRTIDPIRPQDVPDSIGVDRPLHIFAEELSS